MGVLDDIVAGVREDLELRQADVSLERLKERCCTSTPRWTRCRCSAVPGVSVIAEVKRSSPSRGALATIADPAALAAEYEAGGAAVISVLTEQRRFRGSPRRPGPGPARRRHPGPAQGLHRHRATSCSRPGPPAPTSLC